MGKSFTSCRFLEHLNYARRFAEGKKSKDALDVFGRGSGLNFPLHKKIQRGVAAGGGFATNVRAGIGLVGAESAGLLSRVAKTDRGGCGEFGTVVRQVSG